MIAKMKRPSNEYSVALVIRSKDMSVSDISRTLKTRPSRSSDKGRRQVLSRWVDETKSLWCYEIGCPHTKPLDKQIAQLLRHFRQREEQLAGLVQKKCEITIFCGGFPHLATQTFRLSPSILSAISNIGAEFELCTYCYIGQRTHEPGTNKRRG